MKNQFIKIAVSTTALLLSSIAFALTPTQKLYSQAQQISPAEKAQIVKLMQQYDYYFNSSSFSSQYPFGILTILNAAPPRTFPGSCTKLVAAAKGTATIAFNTIQNLEPTQNSTKINIAGTDVPQGVALGVMAAGVAGINGMVIAINKYGQCNPNTYKAMEYLNDITILATAAFHFPTNS